MKYSHSHMVESMIKLIFKIVLHYMLLIQIETNIHTYIQYLNLFYP